MKPRWTLLLIFSISGLVLITAALAGGYLIGSTPQQAYAKDKLHEIQQVHTQLVQNYYKNLKEDLSAQSLNKDIIAFVKSSIPKVKPLIQWSDRNIERSQVEELLADYHNKRTYNAAEEFLRSTNQMALLLQAAKGGMIAAKKYEDLQFFKDLKKIDPLLKDSSDKLDITNIFIVNRDGYVVATAANTVALGANLKIGSFSLIKLARVFHETMHEPRVTYMDFQKLSSRYPKKVAYLSSPIFDNKKVIGLIVYEIPTTKIDSLLTTQKGWDQNQLLGKGEVIAIDSSGLLKSNTRYFFDDPETFIKNLKKESSARARVTGYLGNVPTAALEVSFERSLIEEYRRQNDAIVERKNYMGVKTLQSVGQVHLPDDSIWYVVASLEMPSLISILQANAPTIVLLFIFTILTILGSFLFLYKFIVKPVNKIFEMIPQVSTSGISNNTNDFNNPIIGGIADELQNVSNQFFSEKKSREFLEDSIQSLRQPLFIVEKEIRNDDDFILRVRNFNLAASRIIGHENLRGTLASQWVHFEDQNIIHQFDDDDLSVVTHGNLKGIKDSLIPCDISITRLQTRSVTEQLFLFVLYPNTERRLLQDRITGIERMLKESQKLARIGSFYWDMVTNRVTWTDEIFHLLGVPIDHPNLTFNLYRSLVIAEDLRAFDKTVDHAFKTKEHTDLTYRIRKFDSHNEYLWVRSQGKVDIDAQGNAISMSGTIQDITEAKRAEIETIRSRNKALGESKAMAQFLAQMSHEIRTPMSAIMGMADLLNETPLSKDQKEYVTIFVRAGEVLLNLINDILDISKIEAGEISIENIPYDMNKLVDDVHSIMKPKAINKSLNFVTTIDPNLPLHLMGDPHKLRQVLLNIVGNAVKFTDAGQVELKVHRHPSKKDTLVFSITDTGPGIPDEKQHLIFQKFSQADEAVRRKYGGTGLGLAISKSLVTLMGGKIWFKSHPGKGTAFFVSIPLREQVTNASRGEPIQFEVPTHDFSDVKKKRDHPVRILIADDTSDNRMLFSHFLKNEHFEITEAKNGLEAFDKIKLDEFDIVFMDVQMPEMDGYSATMEIRKWEQEQNREPVPIIALTAHALAEDKQKSLNAGCNDHVSKPFKKATLLQVIDRFL